MSDARYALGMDLAEKLFKITNLQADTQLKLAQHAFLPWQFTIWKLRTCWAHPTIRQTTGSRRTSSGFSRSCQLR